MIQSNKTTKVSAQPAMLAQNRSQVIPPIALPHISGGSVKAEGQLGSFVQKVIDDQVKEAVLDAALHNPTALLQQMQLNGVKGIFFGSKGSEAQ